MSRRVALITDANVHLGPDLARELAKRNHDLVLGDPVTGLATELQETGVNVEVVEGVSDLTNPESMQSLVDRALQSYGRLDAACIRTGKIITGDFLSATFEDFEALVSLNMASVFHALKTLLPTMLAAKDGQIAIVTSAAGARARPGAALYSTTRAAANMMVRNAALSVADQGVTINALGTNFLDYPGFVNASGAADPDVRKRIESTIPVKRLGRPSEVAHFCAALLDGENKFQTGQFFSLSGGWND
jgi:NAD(P)-dependent dehydrogenase (short-subunit alcohol dehydrogenase family)